jgi:hypothetical protein
MASSTSGLPISGITTNVSSGTVMSVPAATAWEININAKSRIESVLGTKPF